jgi:hypothetical protein
MPEAGLGADQAGLAGVDADDLLDLLAHAIRIRLGQVHLVEYRQDLEPLLDRRVAVGHGLRLDALRRVHDQQRALAGGRERDTS